MGISVSEKITSVAQTKNLRQKTCKTVKRCHPDYQGRDKLDYYQIFRSFSWSSVKMFTHFKRLQHLNSSEEC